MDCGDTESRGRYFTFSVVMVGTSNTKPNLLRCVCVVNLARSVLPSYVTCTEHYYD